MFDLKSILSTMILRWRTLNWLIDIVFIRAPMCLSLFLPSLWMLSMYLPIVCLFIPVFLLCLHQSSCKQISISIVCQSVMFPYHRTVYTVDRCPIQNTTHSLSPFSPFQWWWTIFILFYFISSLFYTDIMLQNTLMIAINCRLQVHVPPTKNIDTVCHGILIQL